MADRTITLCPGESFVFADGTTVVAINSRPAEGAPDSGVPAPSSGPTSPALTVVGIVNAKHAAIASLVSSRAGEIAATEWARIHASMASSPKAFGSGVAEAYRAGLTGALGVPESESCETPQGSVQTPPQPRESTCHQSAKSLADL